jgi:hypothetical protein
MTGTVTDGADLRAGYPGGLGAVPPSDAVPEPGTLLLMSTGFANIVSLRRRVKKRQMATEIEVTAPLFISGVCGGHSQYPAFVC